MDTIGIGNYFRQLRKQNKMTQQYVADKLSVSAQAVSKWERSECMPDITLLPEIAKIYSVTVEMLLNGGEENSFESFTDILKTLNSFVDESLFEKVLAVFQRTERVQDLNIRFDFFMILNNKQKDILLDIIMKLDDVSLVLDDIFHYIGVSQRERLIIKIAENKDYEALEPLIPYMSKAVRTKIVSLLLDDGSFQFLEDILPFLSREQKDLIVNYAVTNKISAEVINDFVPFFDLKQKKAIAELYHITDD